MKSSNQYIKLAILANSRGDRITAQKYIDLATESTRLAELHKRTMADFYAAQKRGY